MVREIKNDFQISIANEDVWYPFTLPGSAMTTFLKERIIKDPYDGMNEYEVKDFLRHDFDVKGSFLVTKEEYDNEHIDLIFHGIDTIAEIILNGKSIGNVDNMHRIYKFSCKEHIKLGENELFIKFKSALNFIENYPPTKGKEIDMANTGCQVGNHYLRKAHCMFGWDWGPQLPDIGIYRKIELCCYQKVKLEETLVRQKHEKDKVVLTFTTDVKSHEDVPYEITYLVKDPEGKTLYEGSNTEVEITNPQLWWPNGYGKQPLYKVIVSLKSETDELEEKEYRIGLRTMEISQEEDIWGKEFAFMVNGVKIFARGADYIPDECFYPNITYDILKRDVIAAVYANFNCLRVWGGGYYPYDEFYDLCDEYGIILWQDLMFACNIYDLNEKFIESIEAETRDNLLRFRNHPSLGLICGNNEMEIAWLEWTAVKDHPPVLRKEYLLQFEYLLPRVIKEVAPDVFYWPSSPSSGGSFDKTGDENYGDSHYWDVWHGQKPYKEYQNHYFRFCSEFGFQSLPSIKTIETFTEEKDRNLFSSVMESHQKNPAANGKILYYLSETFRYPKDLKNLVFLSQVMQGYAIKSGVEHWRRNRGRCMGSIYWQFNDNWPVASWSSIDYFGRYKALHYMARKFYAPVAGSIQVEENSCKFWVLNETAEKLKVDVSVYLKSLDFEIYDKINHSVEVEPFTSKCICEKDYEELIKNRKENVFISMECEYVHAGKVEKTMEFETFVPMKHLELKDPEITVSVVDGDKLEVRAKSFSPYCMIDFTDKDIIFDQNVFALTSQDAVVLEVYNKEKKEDLSLDTLEIYDIYHTY